MRARDIAVALGLASAPLFSGDAMRDKPQAISIEVEKKPVEEKPRGFLDSTLAKNYLANAAVEKRDMELENKNMRAVGEYARRFLLRHKFNPGLPEHDPRFYEEAERLLQKSVERMRASTNFKEALAVLQDVQEQGHLKYDPEFYLALMAIESDFEPKPPKTSKGPIGLMQVAPRGEEARHFSHESLHKPEINIPVGVLELQRHIERFSGNIYFGLLAYDLGDAGLVKEMKRVGQSPDDCDQMAFFDAAHEHLPKAWYPLLIAALEVDFKNKAVPATPDLVAKK